MSRFGDMGVTMKSSIGSKWFKEVQEVQGVQGSGGSGFRRFTQSAVLNVFALQFVRSPMNRVNLRST
jgi:hypothetical protein